MDVDPSLVHRLFYPQVPLVMAAQSGERVSAMPVVSYTSVSGRPPMVAVDCMPKGRTYRLAVRARAFSLSVMDRRRSEALEKLATTSGATARDKLLDAGLAHSPGTKLKVPVLAESLATLECKLVFDRRFGDHRLLVAKVEAATCSEAFSDFWDYSKYAPILYTGWKRGLTFYSDPTNKTRSRPKRTA